MKLKNIVKNTKNFVKNNAKTIGKGALYTGLGLTMYFAPINAEAGTLGEGIHNKIIEKNTINGELQPDTNIDKNSAMYKFANTIKEKGNLEKNHAPLMSTVGTYSVRNRWTLNIDNETFWSITYCDVNGESPEISNHDYIFIQGQEARAKTYIPLGGQTSQYHLGLLDEILGEK